MVVVSWTGKVWRAAISSGQRGAMGGLERLRLAGGRGGERWSVVLTRGCARSFRSSLVATSQRMSLDVGGLFVRQTTGSGELVANYPRNPLSIQAVPEHLVWDAEHAPLGAFRALRFPAS